MFSVFSKLFVKSQKQSILNIPLLGIVYFDDNIPSYSNKGNLIVDQEKELVAKCYKNIAKRLQGDDVPLCKYKKKSLFSKIFS